MGQFNIVVATVVTRYFEPEEFDEQGFMTPYTYSFAEVPVRAD